MLEKWWVPIPVGTALPLGLQLTAVRGGDGQVLRWGLSARLQRDADSLKSTADRTGPVFT